jgi:hypothetical protein
MGTKLGPIPKLPVIIVVASAKVLKPLITCVPVVKTILDGKEFI